MSDERTFSQDELNTIVSERLKQERAKIMREVNQREAELTRREALLTAKADWQKRGLPADLLDTLDLSKEGALDMAATILESIRISPNAGRGGHLGKIGYGGSIESSGDAGQRNDPDAALRSAMGLDKKG